MLGGLPQTLRAAGHRTDLTGKPHLAEHHQILRQGLVAETGHHRQQQGQVGGGLRHFHAPHRVHEHILIRHEHPAVTMQHRQQHGQPVLLKPHRHPPRVAQLAAVHQRLNLHQQGAGALPQHHHQRAWGLLLAAGQEYGGGVLHLLQALAGHGEHPQFVGGAEAVLVTPQDAVAAFGAALKHEEAVDDMFQHLGAGQPPLFGDMAHQKQHAAGLLGVLDEIGGAFAHLRHAAGGRRHLQTVHHLNGVHHHQFRLMLLGAAADLLHIGLRQQLETVGGQFQPLRPHAHLLQGFLAGHIQGRTALRRQQAHHLQQQGALARPRIAPHQHRRAWHEAAPQHPIQFAEGGGESGQCLEVYLGEFLHGGTGAGITLAPEVRLHRGGGGFAGGGAEAHLAQGVPGAAGVALALPTAVVGATFGADIGGFALRHLRSLPLQLKGYPTRIRPAGAA